MSDTVRLRDADGNVHYTARGSQAYDRLTRDGAEDLDAPPAIPATAADPTPDVPEVNDAEPAGQGDDHDTGTTGDGPRKRQRATGNADGGDQAAG